jgi:hypothetical protein
MSIKSDPVFKVKSLSDYKIVLEDSSKAMFYRWVDYLLFRNKQIELIVREVTKPNSRKQQCYYRGVVIPHIAEHTGYSVDEVHGVLQKAGLWDDVLPDGTVTVKSTSIGKWTTAEWENRMTRIRAWAINIGVIIPSPNEIDF